MTAQYRNKMIYDRNSKPLFCTAVLEKLVGDLKFQAIIPGKKNPFVWVPTNCQTGEYLCHKFARLTTLKQTIHKDPHNLFP